MNILCTSHPHPGLKLLPTNRRTCFRPAICCPSFWSRPSRSYGACRTTLPASWCNSSSSPSNYRLCSATGADGRILRLILHGAFPRCWHRAVGPSERSERRLNLSQASTSRHHHRGTCWNPLHLLRPRTLDGTCCRDEVARHLCRLFSHRHHACCSSLSQAGLCRVLLALITGLARLSYGALSYGAREHGDCELAGIFHPGPLGAGAVLLTSFFLSKMFLQSLRLGLKAWHPAQSYHVGRGSGREVTQGETAKPLCDETEDGRNIVVAVYGLSVRSGEGVSRELVLRS